MTSINKDIIKLIQERLEVGRRNYGQDVQLEDTRDWVDESIDEALDLAVYLAAELVRIKQLKVRRDQEEAQDFPLDPYDTLYD